MGSAAGTSSLILTIVYIQIKNKEQRQYLNKINICCTRFNEIRTDKNPSFFKIQVVREFIIKSRKDAVLYKGRHLSLKEAVEYAVKNKISLYLANLQGADLQEADLREADLRGADLREAYLYRADLQEANLQGADLRLAKLQGVSLSDVVLERADIRQAVF